MRYSNLKDLNMRIEAAMDLNTPQHILYNLSRDLTWVVGIIKGNGHNILFIPGGGHFYRKYLKSLKKILLYKNFRRIINGQIIQIFWLTWVAENISTFTDILKKLATDKDNHIRAMVYLNPNSGDGIMKIVKNTDEMYKYLG